MATNYRTKYQLNPWEPTDQILRTEVSAENVKIETALDGKLSTIAQFTVQCSLNFDIVGVKFGT